MPDCFKRNTIIAYRIGEKSSPLYCHPECVDQDFPGEGEAIFAHDIEIGTEESLFFPGEDHGEVTDKSIDTTCCGGCGQWFDDDDRLDGLKDCLKKWKGKRC
ncbi:MAG: hypothetical protein J2P36_35915 [Ktedonobacteraceae bacterium]|nr:hypothetical protein [Ktedonobacteraceae bacterium]